MLKLLLKSLGAEECLNESAGRWMNLHFCVPQFAGVSGEMCNQHNPHTFKFVNKTLLVDKRWLNFLYFKIMFNLSADKHWRHGNVNFVTQILKLTLNNVRRPVKTVTVKPH